VKASARRRTGDLALELVVLGGHPEEAAVAGGLGDVEIRRDAGRLNRPVGPLVRGIGVAASGLSVDTLGGMCRRTTCNDCGRPSYAGCGNHVEQVLGDVPADERCPGHAAAERTGGGFFARFRRSSV